MITARSLLQTAVKLLTRSPRTTLSVVAPALVLMCIISFTTALVAPGLLQRDSKTPDIQTLAGSILPLGLVIGFILSYALMAILWHRHTLQDNKSDKALGLRVVAGYLWRVLALALIQLLASLTMVMPLMILTQTGDSSARPPSVASMMLTSLISQTVILWLLLRLSLILPAAALGTPMPMAESWKHTSQIARALWGVAATLAVISTACTAMTAMLDVSAATRAMVFELPISVIEGLLIFSVLTALYAHLVLKKRLGAA